MPAPTLFFRVVVNTLPEITGSALHKPVFADYVRLLAAAALWGATFMVIEVALHDFSPIAIASYRILLAALCIGLVCYWRGLVIPVDRQTITLFAAIGVLNSVIPFCLIGWGQLRIDSSTTAILLATSPFFTLLFSHFMTQDDRFGWSKFFGLVFGFVGVVVLLGQGVVAGSGGFAGMLAVVLAACCYSLSSLLIRKLAGLSSLVLAAGTLTAGCVVLFPLLLIVDPPWQQGYSASTLGAVVFLAVGPTAMAYVLRAKIVKVNGAVFMSNVGYLIPLFAVFWGWLFLTNKPTLVMWLSLALILTGIAIGQRRPESG